MKNSLIIRPVSFGGFAVLEPDGDGKTASTIFCGSREECNELVDAFERGTFIRGMAMVDKYKKYLKIDMLRVFSVLGLDEGEEENERIIAILEKGLRINSDQAAELREYNKALKWALIAIKES